MVAPASVRYLCLCLVLLSNLGSCPHSSWIERPMDC